MNSSNDRLQNFAKTFEGAARDPGFLLILAFEYYDGPEVGLALYPSGEGVRFSSLGDSKSRFLRAFEMAALEGRWLAPIQKLQKAGILPSRGKVVVVSNSNSTLATLESDISHASADGYYVGVGLPNLERLSIAKATQRQLDHLRAYEGGPEAFGEAHQLVKSKANL